MRRRDYHPYIDSYMDGVYSGEIITCQEIQQAMRYVENRLDDPDVWIDHDKIDKAVELIERYFEMTLLDWELFIIAAIHCYYRSDDTVVFSEIFLMMGRGNGKNGFISPLAWYMTTPYHGVNGYSVDIVANAEDQAKTSFFDIHGVLERTKERSKHFFTWTKKEIKNTRTNAYITFNTSNPETKDGKRTGCIIFDEIHGYENWDLISVFESGLGKTKHSRTFYITTDGYVRDGVLDQQKDLAQRVMSGEAPEVRMLPLIYKMDSKEEADDPDMWVKANPSLPYFPELRKKIEESYAKMAYRPAEAVEFFTKRMNLPAQSTYVAAVPWDQLERASGPIPYDELKGTQCLGAFDYARVSDFASCGLLFKRDGKMYWIEHSFVCHLALRVESREIRFPVREMAERGLITIVNGDSITPEHIAGWFLDKAKTYHITNIVADSYRALLLKDAFTQVGLPLQEVRSGPITHARVAPIIEDIFAQDRIAWGDNPTMRWYANNVYQDIDAKGNITYLKQEPHLRKTDGFFALIHALSVEGPQESRSVTGRRRRNRGVYTYS